jgi:hypothetical protein
VDDEVPPQPSARTAGRISGFKFREATLGFYAHPDAMVSKSLR